MMRMIGVRGDGWNWVRGGDELDEVEEAVMAAAAGG